jgi:hypothetical protein
MTIGRVQRAVPLPQETVRSKRSKGDFHDGVAKLATLLHIHSAPARNLHKFAHTQASNLAFPRRLRFIPCR